MFYNQEDEENFLSDKKVGEASNSDVPRRRGGAYQEKEKVMVEEKPEPQQVEQEESESNVFGTVVLVIALVVVIIAAIILFKVFTSSGNENNNNSSTNQSQSTTKDNSSSGKNDSGSDSLAISSLSDMYNTYDVSIKSVVHVKGGNFYNNNEKIKGDKAYVEYKQISGLKDKSKEEKINEKLKSLVVDLYDKNYLGDKDTLFIDVHTKLSVNFNTLSYLVIKTYEDIDGNRKDEKVIGYNIRLDNLEEIKFEDLFTDNANIKEMYSSYVKGKVSAFYFDPKTIYVYDSSMNESKIDMSKNYTNIAIYNRYKGDTNVFTSSAKTQKVFTILNTTVSEETPDRDFEQN